MQTRTGERMTSEFGCPTCPFRKGSFCWAVVERGLSLDADQADISWKSHEGAPANRVLYREGTASPHLLVLCQGWAIRTVQLAHGRRQILSVLLPGEVFSLAQLFEDSLHFSVVSLTEVRLTRLRRDAVWQFISSDPELMASLGTHIAADMRAKDALAVDLGRRRAEERIAHLILQLVDRLSVQSADNSKDNAFPLRQQHIADATGLTPVHVSRVISQFRRENILDLSNGRLTVLDRERLERLGRPV